MYADDIALLADNRVIQIAYKILNELSIEFDMKLNLMKTKYMANKEIIEFD